MSRQIVQVLGRPSRSAGLVDRDLFHDPVGPPMVRAMSISLAKRDQATHIAEARAEPCSFGARLALRRAVCRALWTRRKPGQLRPDRGKATLVTRVGFNTIPIGVDGESSVVARAVVRPQAGCAVIGASRAECGGMERIDRLTCRCSEAKMEI